MHIKDYQPPIKDLGRYCRELEKEFEKFNVFKTALELKLFDYLKEPRTASHLSRETGTHPLLTEKCLDILAAMGFVLKNAGTYMNTEESNAFLMEEGSYYFGNLNHHYFNNYDVFSNLRDVLTEGPKFKEKKHHAYEPEKIRTMAETCKLGRLQETVKIVSGLSGFQKAKRLLDIGGAHGLFAIGFCQENPELSAVVFDQAGVTDVANEYISSYDMVHRITTVAGDHGKDEFGEGFDMVYESFTFSGDKAEMTDYFSRIYRSLNRNGMAVSVRSLLDDNREKPISALLWDFKSCINSGKNTYYTESEFSAILENIGFSGITIMNYSDNPKMDFKLIVAEKK